MYYLYKIILHPVNKNILSIFDIKHKKFLKINNKYTYKFINKYFDNYLYINSDLHEKIFNINKSWSLFNINNIIIITKNFISYDIFAFN